MPLDDVYDPGDALKDMSVLFVTVYCGMLLFSVLTITVMVQVTLKMSLNVHT